MNALPHGILGLQRTLGNRAVCELLSGRATVQRLAAAAPAPTEPGLVRAAAAEGIAGSGGALPHLSSIQRAFGGHDVSGVVAHVDARAAAGARAMGAAAFAVGDHIAFAGKPSLWGAAHEAAHIVQQRSGLSLAGGVGREGDTHERHADSIADAVVHGRSAERLLDRYPARGGVAAQPAVQQTKWRFQGGQWSPLEDEKAVGAPPASPGKEGEIFDDDLGHPKVRVGDSHVHMDLPDLTPKPILDHIQRAEQARKLTALTKKAGDVLRAPQAKGAAGAVDRRVQLAMLRMEIADAGRAGQVDPGSVMGLLHQVGEMEAVAEQMHLSQVALEHHGGSDEAAPPPWSASEHDAGEESEAKVLAGVAELPDVDEQELEALAGMAEEADEKGPDRREQLEEWRRVANVSASDKHAKEYAKKSKMGQAVDSVAHAGADLAVLTSSGGAGMGAEVLGLLGGPLSAVTKTLGAVRAMEALATDGSSAVDKATTGAKVVSNLSSAAKGATVTVESGAKLAGNEELAQHALGAIPIVSMVQGSADVLRGAVGGGLAQYRKGQLEQLTSEAASAEHPDLRGAVIAKFAADAQTAKRTHNALTFLKGAAALIGGSLLVTAAVSNPVGLGVLALGAIGGLMTTGYKFWKRYQRGKQLADPSSPLHRVFVQAGIDVPTNLDVAMIDKGWKGWKAFRWAAREMTRLKLVLAQVAIQLHKECVAVDPSGLDALARERYDRKVAILKNIGLDVAKKPTAEQIARALKA